MIYNVPPENDDFHIDLSLSDREKTWVRPVAIGVAVAGVIFIIATMTTNVAAYLLPMNDEYLQVLIPLAADGGEALALKKLDHEIMDKTMVVRGAVENRTDYPLSMIVAVVTMQDTTGRFPQVVEVPAQPTELPPHGMADFTAMATLQEKPAGYFVKFRIADGPFVPHKDDRASTYGITVK
ncbi:MAG TPA: hypothetical protein VE422_41195 [Terriglobia bacterium]|nr:hypothetical protein [Terriglobia bacterium]